MIKTTLFLRETHGLVAIEQQIRGIGRIIRITYTRCHARVIWQ